MIESEIRGIIRNQRQLYCTVCSKITLHTIFENGLRLSKCHKCKIENECRLR